jgi:hypothetical protein
MPELLIQRPDDTGEYDSTLVRFGDELSYKTETIHSRGYRRTSNPMIESIKNWLMGKLQLHRRGMYKQTWNRTQTRNRIRRRGFHTPRNQEVDVIDKSPVEFRYMIHIGEEGYTVTFHKKKTRYYINGLMGNKDVLIAALARTIYKSCFTDDTIELDNYLIRHIELPEMVFYSLENRAPYYFWLVNDTGGPSKKIDCKLKVKLIADNKVALEISDGVWGELTLKQMNVYMNTYVKKKKQGSWTNLSPAELWEKIMKRKPVEAEEHLMIAFLHQNRTEKVVRERARDLMIHLATRYSDRVKINWGSDDKLLDVSDKPTIMYIHGKLADWKLTDRGLKSQGQQNVSTFVWVNGNVGEKGTWAGPICVDNLDNKSPTGDQFVTRALGLLNDDLLLKRVSTLSGRLNKGHYVGQIDQRISLFQKK